MPIERSLEIERPYKGNRRLVRTGRFPVPMVAKIGRLIATLFRRAMASRPRGRDIRAEKQGDGWGYKVIRPPKAATASGKQLVRSIQAAFRNIVKSLPT